MSPLRRFLDAAWGVVLAALFVAVLLAILFLAGCATGVQMSDEERIACRDAGCTPWTEGELRDLVQRAVTGGYRKGWTDSNNQAARGL